MVQEGVWDVIPAEACYLGRQIALIFLGKLVGAGIKMSIRVKGPTKTKGEA